MKTDHLVCYDYGTGGVWLYLQAESAEQITDRFPEFIVIIERPPWLDEDEEREIRERMTIDIDDAEHWFLAQFLRRRPGGDVAP